MRSVRSVLFVAAIAGLLTLVGCASDSKDSAPTVPESAEVTTTVADTTTTAAPEGTTTRPTAVDGVPIKSKITVTVDGEDTVFSPDKVSCSGDVGDIRRAVGKTNDQAPLIEVTWEDFTLVKLDEQSAPYKANSPPGVTLGRDSVSFKRVFLDGAEVNGSMVCTDWEQ